jgi:cell wall-associated NlpC family hydrolase
MARRVRFPRALALALCGASLATGVVAYGPAASATSVKEIKAQVAAAQRQLHQLNDEAEAAAERYNLARIKLTSAQQAAQSAQARLASAQTKVNRLQSSVRAFAVAAYKGNSDVSMMTLANGSTTQFLNRVSSLQAISARQSETLVGVDAAQRSEEQAQSDADAALAVQRGATAALEADRNQIQAAAAKQQHILAGLQAKERQIIKAAKAAKARAARIAAQQAAARLAAQRAAAARAAAALAAQPVAQPAPQPVSHIPASGGARVAVQWAYREIGKPYVWGAAGPNSFDCSGLAMYVWAKAGVYLAHYTGDQWNEGSHVARSQLEPGDLVFFATNTSAPSTIHHVGIYVGGGEMIDAPYTGAYVRKESAFRSDYIGAVRPG